MRSLVLFGLLLNGTVALAASCKQPSTPDIPADPLIRGHAEIKLNRAAARYIRDSAEYVDCLSADNSVDPSTVAAKQYAALWAVAGLIDLYEARIGPSDKLIAEIRRPAERSGLAPSSDVALRALDSPATATLDIAVQALNAGRYAAARAEIGKLDFDSLTSYERSKAEQILFTISYREEKFLEAREHVQKSIDAGGLRPNEMFAARLTIVNMDVLLRLRNSQLAADQPLE
jgi:hypothetical protein